MASPPTAATLPILYPMEDFRPLILSASLQLSSTVQLMVIEPSSDSWGKACAKDVLICRNNCAPLAEYDDRQAYGRRGISFIRENLGISKRQGSKEAKKLHFYSARAYGLETATTLTEGLAWWHGWSGEAFYMLYPLHIPFTPHHLVRNTTLQIYRYPKWGNES
jgi:hypothetical protein